MEHSILEYLKLNNYSKEVCEEYRKELFSHPDYLSLNAIVESLELLSIETVSAVIDKEQIHDLPHRFIALIIEDDIERMILAHKIGDKIQFSTQDGKTKNLAVDDFTQLWNGFVLLIDKAKKVNLFHRPSLSSIPLIAFTLLLAIGINIFFQVFYFPSFLMQVLSALGVLVSILIIQEDIGKPNPITEKVCKTKSGENSCSSVIKSKPKSFFLGLKFSDLPILFFSSSFLLLTVNYTSFSTIGFLSILGLPVLFYSVILQKIVIKQWCVLCLITASVITSLSINYLLNFRIPTWNTAFVFLSILTSVSLFWSLLKGVLMENTANSEELYKLRRFKRDFDIFNMLFEQSEYYNTQSLEGIDVGKQEALIQLELFLSPSCDFCNKTYQEAYKLLKSFPEKIKLKIYFNLLEEDEETDEDLQIAKKIMEDYIEFNSTEALNDWFSKKISSRDWQNKWGKAEKHLANIDSIIKKQQDFCAKNDWNYAPTLLVDGHLLASQYTAEDIKYFINEIIYNKELSHA